MELQCGADCLKDDWPFGVAGVCDNATSRCICPEGYTGQDEWYYFNDCHVNLALARGMHLTMLVSNLAVVLGHLIIFLLARPKFESVFHLKRTVVKATMRLLRPPRHEKHELGGLDPIHEDDKWRLDKTVLFTVYCLFLYPYFFLLYSVPMGLSEKHYELPVLQDLGRGVASALILASYILINYIWYLSLPNLAMLGQMHDVRTCLIKHPRMVSIVVYTSVLFVFVAVITLATIVPTVFAGELELRQMSDLLFGYVVFGVWCLTLVFLLGLRFLLYNLFKELENSFASVIEVNTQRSLKHAKRTVNAWSRLSVAILIPTATMSGISVFSYFGQRHVFLLFTGSAILPGIAGCLYVAALFKTLRKHRLTSYSKFPRAVTTVSYNNTRRTGSVSKMNTGTIVIHDI